MSLTSLDIQGYGGLDTLIRAGFLRPVQIVRQTISHTETQIRRISAYHNYEGLSSIPQNGGESRRITYIPGRITNPMSGYVDMLLLGLLEIRFGINKLIWFFIFSIIHPVRV
jgi:hypothetical protein